jgi:hypothetical protein
LLGEQQSLVVNASLYAPGKKTKAYTIRIKFGLRGNVYYLSKSIRI